MTLRNEGRPSPQRNKLMVHTGQALFGAVAALSIALASGHSVSASDSRAGAASQESVEGADAPSIRLAGGVTINTSTPSRSLAEVASDPLASKHRIIRLADDAGAADLAQLLAAGVVLGDPFARNTYAVNMSQAEAGALAGLDFVRWNSAMAPEWKLDPEIGQRPAQTPQRAALAAQGRVALELTLFPAVEGDRTGAALKGMDGVEVHRVERIGDSATTISASAPLDLVDQIAELDEVQHVSEHPEAMLRNASTRWIVQSSSSGDTPLYAAGIRGEGQILGVLDSRVSPSHCSFSDNVPFGSNHRKIEAYNTSTGTAFHGTHVAGTAVGDGGDSGNTRGVAYRGRLVYNTTPSYLSESSFLARLDLHHSQGARVHTNSWGADFRTDYNGWSRAIDVFTWENEDDVVLFAVTNQSQLFTPENAKNVLAVGATWDSPNQDAHSSGGAGPTADGRRKPEIYAPGRGSISASGSGCGTTSSSGTSMAAPAVAGSVMLARQYFMDGFYPTGESNPADAFTPTGALLRATVLNSAVDMTGVSGYPSNLEGWGRILLDNTLHMPGDSRSLLVWDNRRTDDDALAEGEMNSHEFEVNSNDEQLRVTMVFTDAPAAPGAFQTRINDLDLEVVSPSGTVYRGNVFSGGASAAGGSADSINTVEQVHVNNPEVGRWEIRVIGTEVATMDPQSYGLVATGGVSAVQSAPCDWDLDGDGLVGAADVGVLLGAWGEQFGPSDLGELLGSWGPCP